MGTQGGNGPKGCLESGWSIVSDRLLPDLHSIVATPRVLEGALHKSYMLRRIERPFLQAGVILSSANLQRSRE